MILSIIGNAVTLVECTPNRNTQKVNTSIGYIPY